MNNIHEQNTLGDTKRLTKWSKTELVPQRCFFSGRICIHVKMWLKINEAEWNRCTSNRWTLLSIYDILPLMCFNAAFWQSGHDYPQFVYRKRQA